MLEQDREAVLKLEEVSLHFKSRKNAFNHGVHTILEDVSMAVHRGETLGIIGSNGCGKSTILRLLSGIIAPSSGRVIQRENLSVALLSLGLGFRPTLSGRDNAMFSSMLQGYSKSEALARVDEIKEFSELGDSFEEQVKTYSSGMRSRLGFSTAVVAKVDVLLIDEILSVGDAHFRQKAQATLMNRIEGDQTVVFVSHAAPQVKRLCQRTIWLHEGRVEAEGETPDVLEAYARYVESIKSP
jgi:homopolymeric O-antigen transport system ATP-binding protein